MDKIHVLMGQAMASIRAVEKDRRFDGPGGFNFRGIDATMNAVGPVFRELGIVGPVPELLEVDYSTVDTGKRPMNRCTVKVRYWFYGPSGDSMSASVPGESIDVGDKGTAKAMSVACRIALLQVLCLPTQEPDPDDFVGGMSELDYARDGLTAEMRRLKIDPNKVIALYASEHEGADPRTDTDVARLRDFTAGLKVKARAES